MNKKKELYDNILMVISEFGNDIVKQERFVSILCDYHSFSDMPATKIILHDIIKDGYGEKLYDFTINKDENFQIKVKSYIMNLVRNYGFNTDLVDYVFNCLLYGLKLTDVIPDFKKDENTIPDNTNNIKPLNKIAPNNVNNADIKETTNEPTSEINNKTIRKRREEKKSPNIFLYIFLPALILLVAIIKLQEYFELGAIGILVLIFGGVGVIMYFWLKAI